jgi:putative hydrolase
MCSERNAPGQLQWIGLGCEQAAEAGVDPAKVVNAWDADGLLGWTASNGS